MVSVIIPCFNQGKTLRRAVDSAMEADEIIIVNDGSNDETADIGRTYHQSGKVFYLEVLSDFPGGVCNARNLGITFTRDNSLIIPLDADDEFLAGGIQKMVKLWKPDTFVVPSWIEDNRIVTPPPAGMLTKKAISRATICFHKDAWKKAGGYNALFNLGAEDWAFTIALLQAGISPTMSIDPSYIYHRAKGGKADAALRRKSAIRDLLKEIYNVEPHL